MNKTFNFIIYITYVNFKRKNLVETIKQGPQP